MIAQSESQNSSTEYEGEGEFLKMLPQLEKQISYAFRHLDADAKQEAVQDGVVNCFQAYQRLVQSSRSDDVFPSALASFAICQIRAGRECACRMNGRDPLSRYAQHKHGIRVERLDGYRSDTEEWIEPLVEDRRASIPDRVAMKIDVPEWLATISRRKQKIANDLAVGCSTSEVAKKYRLSAGRISQIRKELYESWNRFHESGIRSTLAMG